MMTPSKRFNRALICAYRSAQTASWAENCASRFIFSFRYLRFGLLFDLDDQGPHAAGRWQLPQGLQNEVDFVYVEVEGHAWLQGRAVLAGLTGGVIMLSIWPCTQACALVMADSGIHERTTASVKLA